MVTYVMMVGLMSISVVVGVDDEKLITDLSVSMYMFADILKEICKYVYVIFNEV